MYKNKFLMGLLIFNFSSAAHSESYAVLERNGTDYKLSDTVSFKNESKSSMVRSTWPFKTVNFDPAFETKPVECIVNESLKKDECAPFRDKEIDFLHLNKFQSSYGTPLSQRTPTTAGSVAGSVAGAVLGGVLVAPVAIALSPFLLLGMATSKESKKWAEFNHDEFNNKIQMAIKKAGFDTRESFIDNMNKIDRMGGEFNKTSNELREKFISDQKKEVSADFGHILAVGIKSNAATFRYSTLAMPSFLLRYENQFEKSIIDSLQENDLKNRLKFKDIKNSEASDLSAKYDNHLLKEKERIAAEKSQAEDLKRRTQLLEEEERKKRDAQNKINEKKFAIEKSRIEKFRTQIQPGDDIHCGMIIEIKGPMVKISINAQLQGYANETWIRKSEAFPAEYGCSNRNGRLSTLHAFDPDSH